MIEVNKTYEFLPGIDQQVYGKKAKKWKEMMLRVPGRARASNDWKQISASEFFRVISSNSDVI